MPLKDRNVFWTITISMMLIWLNSPAWAVENQTSGDKVAVVNGSVITQEEFNREMGRVRQQLSRRGKAFNDSELSKIKKETLERLISIELLYQDSRSKGIEVEKALIDEKMTELKKRFPGEDGFKKALTLANLSLAALESQIKRDLAIQKLIDKHFVQKVTVTGNETKAYFDSHPEAFKKDEQVRASHILIKVDPQADESKKAAARKKIKEIQKKLAKGEDLAALAREYSEGPSSSKGGDLGYFSRGQMVKPFEDAAFNSAPNQVSDLVETRFGYHIIKVTGKKPQTIVAYADVKDRLQEYLKQKKVQEQLHLYIDKLKEKASVEKFLNEKSE